MIHLNVCIGSACHVKGAYNMISLFQQMIEEGGLHDQVELKGVFCMGQCAEDGVSVRIGDGAPNKLTPMQARTFFQEQVLAKVTEQGGEKQVKEQ